MPLMDVNPSIMEKLVSFVGVQVQDSVYLTNSYNPPDVSKDISHTPVTSLPKVPAKLDSDEQQVLQDIKIVAGNELVSGFQLQFAPQWILYKSIAMEKANYGGAYEEVDIRKLLRNANIMSSYHFF